MKLTVLTLALLLSACAASPPPKSAATFPPAMSPALVPIACNKLVAEAHLDKLPVNADSLGQLVAVSLKLHQFNGASPDVNVVRIAMTDVLGCFSK